MWETLIYNQDIVNDDALHPPLFVSCSQVLYAVIQRLTCGHVSSLIIHRADSRMCDAWPQDTWVPVDIVQRLWAVPIPGDAEGPNTDAMSVPATLEFFASSSLILQDTEDATRGIRVHDLQVVPVVCGGGNSSGVDARVPLRYILVIVFRWS